MMSSLPVQTPIPVARAGALHVLRDDECGQPVSGLSSSDLGVQAQRVLALLASPDCFGRTALVAGKVSVIGKRGGVSLVVGQVDLIQIDALVQSGHVIREGQGEVLTYRIARQPKACPAKPVQAARSSLPKIGTRQNKPVRAGQESPLEWLSRRKDKSGQPMISTTALAAGERLQRDFMQAGMSPKMSADWSGLPASGSAQHGGALLHSERQMAAQQRLRRALDACGGDLAGVLLDLCCFLKPLEAVEQERGWPARSGKVILKLALSALMRHYGLSEQAKGLQGKGKIRIWHAPEKQDGQKQPGQSQDE